MEGNCLLTEDKYVFNGRHFSGMLCNHEIIVMQIDYRKNGFYQVGEYTCFFSLKSRKGIHLFILSKLNGNIQTENISNDRIGHFMFFKKFFFYPLMLFLLF